MPRLTHAQSVAAGVVVVPRGADTVAVPRARMLLHRVGRDVQGPIDSMVADARGRFRIRFEADTSALYLLSARFGGIEYFSSPIHTNPALPDTAIRMLVYDTSSTAPITVAARHIVVPRPGDDGARAVLDLVVLRNAGMVARVAGDSVQGSWSSALPAASRGLEVGESDLSPDAVIRRGDSVLVLAPIAPGEKQVVLQYVLPAGEASVDFPIADTGAVNLLVEEPGAIVAGGTMAQVDSQQIEGRWFHRWSGHVSAGRSLRLTLPTPAGAPRVLLGALVIVLAVALGLAAWWIARTRRPVPPASPLPPDRLLDALAGLDARFEGREAEVSPEEWARYRDERARLKAALESALAVVGTRP